MYMTCLISLMMFMTMLAPLTESIITLGALLMVLAVTSTLLITSSLGSWFGFILFLMYITGMLVLFSYMLAMTPNNQYTKPVVTKVALGASTVMVLMMSQMCTAKTQMNPLKAGSSTEEEITQLYNNMSMNMYWTMALTLLVALLMAVKLCYKSPKPLRQFLK